MILVCKSINTLWITGIQLFTYEASTAFTFIAGSECGALQVGEKPVYARSKQAQAQIDSKTGAR